MTGQRAPSEMKVVGLHDEHIYLQTTIVSGSGAIFGNGSVPFHIVYGTRVDINSKSGQNFNLRLTKSQNTSPNFRAYD
jgi:hypothetical protein